MGQPPKVLSISIGRLASRVDGEFRFEANTDVIRASRIVAGGKTPGEKRS
jgi:hypothetical protein